MATPIFHTGKLCGASINGTAIPIEEWTLTPSGEIAKFKNSGITGNTPQYEGTWIEYKFSIKLARDFANNPWGTPLSFTPLQQLTNLKFYEHQSAPGNLDGPVWIASNGIVETTPQTASETNNNEMTLMLTGYLYGTITPPTT